uniref:DUF243 domain-containing protein n=1 Tax=Anopheles culicifacies TaxID=139723 RepID=A0A182M765_9DIPT
MKHLLVLSALALALASARPEGYSYYTPHSSNSGHSATSSASVQFTSGAGSSVASAVDDCEEPEHEQLSPFQHSQVHFFAPQTQESSSYLKKEEIHQKVILPTYTKQKHYKIIFIKAPSPPTVSKVVLPQQPVNEEKTLVYVLHKKPELEQEIVVPPPATSKPSKPEVYFIKYKTKKQEQQHSYHHEEQHSSSSTGGGFEVADLSGYGGSFGSSFAPIVVTEGSYHSTTAAPLKVTTVHSVLPTSTVTPSSSYLSSTASSHGSHKAQSIKITNIGLSGYSTGGSSSVASSSSSGSSTSSRQRGSKKSCGKCSKTSSAPVSVGGTLDAFVSNVY